MIRDSMYVGKRWYRFFRCPVRGCMKMKPDKWQKRKIELD